MPLRFPSTGQWLLTLLARDGRFVFGPYRRHSQTISVLGEIDRLFGVPVTTRSWRTLAAIAKVLDTGATDRPAERCRERRAGTRLQGRARR